MKKRIAAALTTAMTLTLGCNDGEGDITSNDALRFYDVTIENLTTGQPFSPGIVVTHTAAADIYQVGSAASRSVIRIAEGGDPSAAGMDLPALPGIDHVETFQRDVFPRNSSMPSTHTVRVSAGLGVDRLSVVTMLICTNDGFTGVDGVALPTGSEAVSYTGSALDAGAEVNNERFDHIVEPCHAIGPKKSPPDGQRLAPETGVIRPHPGIQGVADLDRTLHSWPDPVVRITITRAN